MITRQSSERKTPSSYGLLQSGKGLGDPFQTGFCCKGGMARDASEKWGKAGGAGGV